MVESKSCVELQSTLNRHKSEEKSHRRILFSELKDHCGSRTLAKTRLNKYKKHKSTNKPDSKHKSTNKPDSDNGEENEEEVVDSDEDSVVSTVFEDSQESLLGEILESDQQVAEHSEQLKLATEKVKKYIK